MNIREHHKRTGKRLLLLSFAILFATVSCFFYDYVVNGSNKMNKRYIEYISPLFFGVFFFGLSFIERKRGMEIIVAGRSMACNLLEYPRFVIRPEATFFTTINYFSLKGIGIATLREQYTSVFRKLLAGISFFVTIQVIPKLFTLYNAREEVVMYIKRKFGVAAVFEFYDANGTYMGKLQEMWKIKGVEWRTFSADGEEIGRIIGDVHGDWLKGDWSDGSKIEMKEDGIPLEAMQSFAASGSTLVDVSTSGEGAVVYYVIPALILAAKKERK